MVGSGGEGRGIQIQGGEGKGPKFPKVYFSFQLEPNVEVVNSIAQDRHTELLSHSRGRGENTHAPPTFCVEGVRSRSNITACGPFVGRELVQCGNTSAMTRQGVAGFIFPQLYRGSNSNSEAERSNDKCNSRANVTACVNR